VKIIQCRQGDEAWFNSRMGRPTASCFDKIIAPKTLKISASADRYMHLLLAERMLGIPMESASTDFMERGSALEQEAVNAYEFQRDVVTEAVGFCTTDDGRIGCSPDRLVNPDGLLEVKCLAPPQHVGALLGRIDDGHRLQCYGQLLVTERLWVDLLCYHPLMPTAIVRVESDPEAMAALAEAVGHFLDRLEQAEARLRASGLWVEPVAVGRDGAQVVGMSATGTDLLRAVQGAVA